MNILRVVRRSLFRSSYISKNHDSENIDTLYRHSGTLMTPIRRSSRVLAISKNTRNLRKQNEAPKISQTLRISLTLSYGCFERCSGS